MDKFRNKYRIASVRLKSWDYGTNAAYFITICTQSMKHFFGEIVDGEMQLNEMGQLAEKHWLEIPIHFPFIELGNLVVMPNHVHGILIINKIDTPINAPQIADTQLIDTPQIVKTRLIASLQICAEYCIIVQTLHCNVSAIAMENLIMETLRCNVCTNSLRLRSTNVDFLFVQIHGR